MYENMQSDLLRSKKTTENRLALELYTMKMILKIYTELISLMVHFGCGQ